jgi:hypothetical protein
MEYIVDFNNCRAIILEGGEKDRISLTTVQDLAKIVALAVEYEGEWPLMGGMRGSDLCLQELFDIGERVRGTCKVLKPSSPSPVSQLLTHLPHNLRPT